MKSLNYYNELIQRIDAFINDIVASYGTQLQCASGCYECCTLESILPVEIYPILEWYSIQPQPTIDDLQSNCESGYCLFLQHSMCRIYPFRPIICRTHGYPILVDNRVDICPRNDGIAFEKQHILNVEHCNTMLTAINLLFLKDIGTSPLQQERINLREFFQSSESDILSIVHSLKRY